MRGKWQAGTRAFIVDRERTIDFMGEDARVYATPMLVRDIEVTCRELLLGHLEPGEDSVGTRVEIDHLAATLAELEGRAAIFDIVGTDGLVQKTCHPDRVLRPMKRGNPKKGRGEGELAELLRGSALLANPAPARDGAELRTLSAKDLEDVVRIDRHVTGREPGVRISLAARLEGVTAGFVMARADLGDFGRTEPVAVLDTIGVAPEYARQGLGRALLEQLFLNLQSLRIERVETVVAADALGLLGFFHGAGFAPAERLAFVRPLAA